MNSAQVLRFLEGKDIERTKWDQCIERSSQQLPYAFSWFLDIASENWSGIVLNDFEAVMPVAWKKKMGIRMIYQPFFTQQLGVFGTADVKDFLNIIPSHFRYVHTNFNYLNQTDPGDKKFSEQVNLILKIDDNSANYFSENCRRNITRSGKNFLNLKNCDEKELISIFRDTRGKNIQHLKQKNYDTLQQLIQSFAQRKMCDITGVYDEEHNLLGGAVLVHYKERSIFFFSALTEKGKEKAAMYFLISEFIKKSSGRILDFEGSNDPGLQRFYKGFGAYEQNYFSFVNNQLPQPLRLLKK